MYTRTKKKSFQYSNVWNKATLARTGMDNGNTIFVKILNSPAPSIFADSNTAGGIELWKNVRMTKIQNPETRKGIIKANMLSRKPRTFTYTRYHGIKPPLNNRVKIAKNEKNLLCGKSGLEIG